MTERGILMSAPMVRAILAGTKSQTRRAIKTQPTRVVDGLPYGDGPTWAHAEPGSALMRSWYGSTGTRLWVRETWARDDEDGALLYRADLGLGGDADDWERNRLDGVGRYRWRPSIHMPRAASRITLEVTEVRVERIQSIREADALAEGIVETRGGFGLPDGSHYHAADPRESYWSLFEAINGRASLEADVWCWCVSFRRITP